MCLDVLFSRPCVLQAVIIRLLACHCVAGCYSISSEHSLSCVCQMKSGRMVKLLLIIANMSMFSNSTAGRQAGTYWVKKKFIPQQVMHKNEVTLACVQRCQLSRLLCTDCRLRLIGFLFLAFLLHCITAAVHGAWCHVLALWNQHQYGVISHCRNERTRASTSNWFVFGSVKAFKTESTNSFFPFHGPSVFLQHTTVLPMYLQKGAAIKTYLNNFNRFLFQFTFSQCI